MHFQLGSIVLNKHLTIKSTILCSSQKQNINDNVSSALLAAINYKKYFRVLLNSLTLCISDIQLLDGVFVKNDFLVILILKMTFL